MLAEEAVVRPVRGHRLMLPAPHLLGRSSSGRCSASDRFSLLAYYLVRNQTKGGTHEQSDCHGGAGRSQGAGLRLPVADRQPAGMGERVCPRAEVRGRDGEGRQRPWRILRLDRRRPRDRCHRHVRRANRIPLFPTRVVALPPGGSAFLFTMFQGAEMSDELFESQYQSLLREFKNIEQEFGR